MNVYSVKYSFSLMSIRKGARCHLDHSHTLLGIYHLEVLVYLWLSTGVSLCSNKTIGRGGGGGAKLTNEESAWSDLSSD